MDEELKNKVVLITGAGKGLGRGAALAFGKRDAVIAANDLTPINLDQTLSDIARFGGRARDYIFDVARKMPVSAMVKQITDDWGKIDILINHASVEPSAQILQMDEWDWRRTIDVNLTAAFFTIQSVGQVMKNQGGGVILNIIPEMMEPAGLANLSAHHASMQGLAALSRVAAQEFLKYNIRVNAVRPDVDSFTKLNSEKYHDTPHISTLDHSKTEQHLVGNVIDWLLFLCSRDADQITGQDIYINYM